MTYRVVWRDRIRRNVAQFVFLAGQMGGRPADLLDATDRIELLLSDNPADEGESREGAERVLTVRPLTVQYEVFEARQTVLIYDAVYYPGRRA